MMPIHRSVRTPFEHSALKFARYEMNNLIMMFGTTDPLQQLRIDFLFFELEEPSATRRPYVYCAGDRLSVNGMKFDLCGRLVNQHGKNCLSVF